MSSSFARLFCALFPAMIVTLALIVLVGAGAYYVTTGNGLTATVLALVGVALLIALFGMVALMIENNQLLHRIATAVETTPRGMPQVATAAMAEDKGPSLVATRVTAAPARAAAVPQGRVEPVLTISRRTAAPQP